MRTPRPARWVTDGEVLAVCAELIRRDAPFSVKPKPNGWWSVKADLPSRPVVMENEFDAIVQMARGAVR